MTQFSMSASSVPASNSSKMQLLRPPLSTLSFTANRSLIAIQGTLLYSPTTELLFIAQRLLPFLVPVLPFQAGLCSMLDTLSASLPHPSLFILVSHTGTTLSLETPPSQGTSLYASGPCSLNILP